MNQIPKILKLLAFGGAIAAGLVLIILAIIHKTAVPYPFAVVAFFGGITGFIFGTSGEPSGSVDPPKIGGKFMGLPDWVVIVDGVLLLIAVILAFVLH